MSKILNIGALFYRIFLRERFLCTILWEKGSCKPISEHLLKLLKSMLSICEPNLTTFCMVKHLQSYLKIDLAIWKKCKFYRLKCKFYRKKCKIYRKKCKFYRIKCKVYRKKSKIYRKKCANKKN